MDHITANQIAAELSRIIYDISYAELYPDTVNFDNARRRTYKLAAHILELAEPHAGAYTHAAILPVGERHARIAVER